MMTPRERIVAALAGEWADQVPLSIYWNMLPRGDAERSLRNSGFAIVHWVDPLVPVMPNVEVTTREFYDRGNRIRREVVSTPVGEVYSTQRREHEYGTSWWRVDHYIKSPEDYRVAEFMVADTGYVKEYGAVESVRQHLGEDGYVFARVLNVPMHRMIYDFIGLERFCTDLVDRPDDVYGLHELLEHKQRETFDLVADVPADFIMCGANFHQDVMGPRRFEQFYLPYLNDFADAIHAGNKIAACHLDAPMRTLLSAVAKSKVDVLEALTPPPTCDVTVAEARAACPDKVLWINFPSAVHAMPSAKIRADLETILREAVPGDRFLVGITENVPEAHWRRSLQVIADVVNDRGHLPLESTEFDCTASALA